MFERFTDKARGVLVRANAIALKLNHDALSTEHLLIGILLDTTCIACGWITDLGINPSELMADLYKDLPALSAETKSGKLPLSTRAKSVVKYANDIAVQKGCVHVGTEHILLGILKEKESQACILLMSRNLTEEKCQDKRSTPFEPSNSTFGDLSLKNEKNAETPENVLTQISGVLLEYLSKKCSATEAVIRVRKLV